MSNETRCKSILRGGGSPWFPAPTLRCLRPEHGDDGHEYEHGGVRFQTWPAFGPAVAATSAGGDSVGVEAMRLVSGPASVDVGGNGGAGAGAVAKPEHPAPWAWREPFDDEAGIEMHCVDDANGKCVVADRGGIEDPLTRELIRLAPDMAALLQKLEWIDETHDVFTVCPVCGSLRPGETDHRSGRPPYPISTGHDGSCELGRILAALDAARGNHHG